MTRGQLNLLTLFGFVLAVTLVSFAISAIWHAFKKWNYKRKYGQTGDKPIVYDETSENLRVAQQSRWFMAINLPRIDSRDIEEDVRSYKYDQASPEDLEDTGWKKD